MTENVIFPLRIDPVTLAALETIARAEGRTKAGAARWAIREYARAIAGAYQPAPKTATDGRKAKPQPSEAETQENDHATS